MRTDLALDAPEQAMHHRPVLDNLTHHTDRGPQYLPTRYADPLAAAGRGRSVGATGGPYDNAFSDRSPSIRSELLANVGDGGDHGRSVNTTRRFFLRPSLVSFVAIGRAAP